MHLLKLEKDDPERELEFEVKCGLEIPPDERLQHWLEWNLTMLDFIKKQQNESRKTPQIVKRP